jgi:hypothetical protein
MKWMWIVLLSLAALGGCQRASGGRPAASGDDARARAEAPPGKRLVCHKEKVIGSHQKREVCQWEKDPNASKAREAYQDSLRQQPPAPAIAE